MTSAASHDWRALARRSNDHWIVSLEDSSWFDIMSAALSARQIADPAKAPDHVCTVHLASEKPDAIAAFFLSSKSLACFLCIAKLSKAISDLAFCFNSKSCVHQTQNSSSLLRLAFNLFSSSISAAVCIHKSLAFFAAVCPGASLNHLSCSIVLCLFISNWF